MNKNLAAIVMLATLVSSSGCWFHRNTFRNDPLAPVAFTAPPTLDDIIFTVNANTDRIQQLSTDTATLSMPGLPVGLKTSFSVERPRRFRLRAKFLSPEVDLGSNDELFWFWAKNSPEPAVYYARHEEYSRAASHQFMPIDPTMLIEALGLVRLEPGAVLDGPYPRADGQVEVYDRGNGTNATTRLLVVDAKYGWISEQHLFGANRNPIASVRASGHRHYRNVGASVPHQIDISMAGITQPLRIEVGDYWINQLGDDPAQLWRMPELPGYTPVNVASPQFQPPQNLSWSNAPTVQPPPPESRIGLLPKYRGHGHVSR